MHYRPSPGGSSKRVTRGGSRWWDLFFRASYRMVRILDPMIRAVRRAVPLATIEEILITGRTTGRERQVLVTLLTVEGRTYVGHPNGARASWIRNLMAAGRATIVYRDGRRTPVRAVLVAGGHERASVIRSTFAQQPIPANLAYWLARRHIDAVGMYFRLEPVDVRAGPSTEELIPPPG